MFEHPSEAAGPSHPPPGTDTCSVCGTLLPADLEAASSHVAGCLAERGGSSESSEGESYEEYTWCNVTRVRATSMLSPQARAGEWQLPVALCSIYLTLDSPIFFEM